MEVSFLSLGRSRCGRGTAISGDFIKTSCSYTRMCVASRSCFLPLPRPKSSVRKTNLSPCLYFWLIFTTDERYFERVYSYLVLNIVLLIWTCPHLCYYATYEHYCVSKSKRLQSLLSMLDLWSRSADGGRKMFISCTFTRAHFSIKWVFPRMRLSEESSTFVCSNFILFVLTHRPFWRLGDRRKATVLWGPAAVLSQHPCSLR